MKTLAESIFSNNIKRDPFKDLLDRLEINDLNDTLSAIKQLYSIPNEEFSLSNSDDSLLRDYLSKENYIMILKRGNRSYTFAWLEDWKKHKDTLVRYFIYGLNPYCYWNTNSARFTMSLTDDPDGVSTLIEKLRYLGGKNCVFITDPKKIDAIKEKLTKLKES